MKIFRRPLSALAAITARLAALEKNGVSLPLRLSAQQPTTYTLFTVAGASIGLAGPLDAHYRALKAVSFRVLAGPAYWAAGNAVQVLDAGRVLIASGVWAANPDQQAELPALLALDNPVVLAAGADFYLRTAGQTVVDSNRGAGTTSTDGSIRFLDSATMTVPALNFLSGPLLPKQTVQPLDPADFPIVTSAAQLIGAGVALLVDNVRGPRLIRRAAGGALSYGAPLSVTDSDSGSGTPRLSASSTLTPVLRSPVLPGAAALNALNLYRVFTPAADTVLVGLRDNTAHTGPVRAYVWESGIVGQPRAVGSKATPNGATTYESRFDNPITLIAGQRYLIGWAAESGQVLSGTDSPALAYQGFDVSIRSQYANSYLNYPDNLLGNNQFPLTFDLLTATAVQPKGVIGPSDPLDFPVVTDPAQLGSGLALLDDGVAAPRLIRKRADGSVWLGAVFAPPAVGFKVYRLNITAGGDGNYSAVSELQLHAAVGGPSVAQGGAASDNSRLSNDYPGSNAFDGDATTSWISAGLPSAGGPKILTYTFPNAVKLAEYSISAYVGARAPHAWTFEGSPDGAAWTVLDTQTGQVFADGTARAFPVANG